MAKSKDKKASRETKEDKKLALGVKRKQLKTKKGRGLDRATEGEDAAKNGATGDKELARHKKTALMKQKKKIKHAKVKSNHTMSDGLDGKDDATPKLNKKKTKKKPMESSSPVKVYESSFVSHDSETPKLKKKKTKKKPMESRSPVKVYESSFVSHNSETPKLKKKKRKVKERKSSAGLNDAGEILHEIQDEETQSRADVNQLTAQSEDVDNRDSEKAKREKKINTKKVKKSGKANKTDKLASSKENNLERHVEVSTANVDEIPSVDEDCSRGMKKWILEYKQKRPGLKVLQERIDEFIIAHEERQEKERQEREAHAAEEGWTVVVHHKGRKKTTDAETGIAVGSVSLAAMQEKMANKKPKEVAPNFYRFQKREAQLSELAMLQSKFEQDKKRIQQLRAQRKFKPY